MMHFTSVSTGLGQYDGLGEYLTPCAASSVFLIIVTVLIFFVLGSYFFSFLKCVRYQQLSIFY